MKIAFVNVKNVRRILKILLKPMKNTFREFILKRGVSKIFFKGFFLPFRDSYSKEYAATSD